MTFALAHRARSASRRCGLRSVLLLVVAVALALGSFVPAWAASATPPSATPPSSLATATVTTVATTSTTDSPASAADARSELSYLDAVVLGVVEGVTEFLPVSSTGHLLVTGRLLGLDGTDAFDSYAIAIQAGAIIAVLILYRPRAMSVLRGVFAQDQDGRRLAVNLVVAFVPAAVIGLVLEGPIKDRLFSPWAIAAAWAVGGVVILLFEQRRRAAQFHGRRLEELTVRMALIVGCAQVFALWPGASRSLVTILAGLLLGLQVGAAVELSFLLGLLTVGAATSYETLKNGSTMLDAYGLGRPLVGLVAALVSAVVAVRWMVSWLQSRGLAIFGWYRIGVAALLVVLLVTGTV